jgi:hypothetical protein
MYGMSRTFADSGCSSHGSAGGKDAVREICYAAIRIQVAADCVCDGRLVAVAKSINATIFLSLTLLMATVIGLLCVHVYDACKKQKSDAD